MSKKTILAFVAISGCLSITSVQAGTIKTFRDCKNITDAIQMSQLKKKGELSKEFVTKVGPAANKLMELCADGKYSEADAARIELEKITGPIGISSTKGPGGPR